MIVTRVLPLLATAFLVVQAPASAAENGEFTFTVLKDGSPIGEHRFAFQSDGERVEIAAATDLEVKFAMIPLYSFAHERHEVWENGEPVLITSRTDDDGETFDIEVRPNGDGYVRTVNGRIDEFESSVKVLGFWDEGITKFRSFFSVVEDKVIKAAFEYIGKETVEIDGTALPAEHYRMVGDIERDVWFDQAGRGVKIGFDRKGSLIEYVRNEVEPLALQCAGSPDAIAQKLC
jgi:hypothetical protein